MAKINSGPAEKGSRFHLQKLVNCKSDYLNKLILSKSPSLREYITTELAWVSPLACKNYREYQGSAFLEILGLSDLKQKLSEFWPRFGPSWDALATVTGKYHGFGVILLESKSHFRELGNRSSACGAKNEKSLEKIKTSISIVKNALGVIEDHNWLGNYYQYANRLSHLYWLNVIAEVPTWMVLLYFTGDKEQRGPNTEAKWQTKLSEIEAELGLPKHHLLSNHIIKCFSSVYNEIRNI